jgi:hypothetical protein
MFNKSSFLKTLFILAIAPFFALKADLPQTIDYDFSKDHQGWIADFADYPINQETFYELSWGWENLPVDTDAPYTKGLFLSGNNHSDDLFMFLKRQIVGLEPNTLYTLTCEATLESNIPVGTLGIGGSPGESVYVKIGASTQEPQKIANNGFYFLNVDKGNQSQGGANALLVGNLANPEVDPENPQYLPLVFIPQTPLQVQSDNQGQLWIFLGTDSGYEGSTKFYLVNFKLVTEPFIKF